MSNDTHPTTNRHQTLALGGESPEELVALQQREDMRHDGVYSSSIHRLWSIFIKDKNSHVHRESYLAGLSNFCQVLMPNLPESEALELAANDWEEDIGHFSSDGSTLDFDGFYLAMSELTDLWCPVTDADDYSSFVDSLFKRSTVRVVHDPDGSVIRRDLARSQYVFVGEAPPGDDVADAKKLKLDVMSENLAATKMQAAERGKSSRRQARDDWLSNIASKFNPMGLDLRRSITKQKEKAAQKMQAITRGRVGRKKVVAARIQKEKKEQDTAAQRMQAIHRGRAAREEVKKRKLRKQYSSLIPKGMDLRRPSSKRLSDLEEQEKSALLMQKMTRSKNARVAVQEKREQRNAAVKMQNIQRGRLAKKRVGKIREEKKEAATAAEAAATAAATATATAAEEKAVAVDQLANSGSFQLQRGTYHEVVDYEEEILLSGNDSLVSYEWATSEEIANMQKQSESARPPMLLEGQSMSPMWENPTGEHFAENNHPLIQGRHHSHLRLLHVEEEEERATEEAMLKIASDVIPSAPAALTSNVTVPEGTNEEKSIIHIEEMARELNPKGLDLRRPHHHGKKKKKKKTSKHMNKFKAVSRTIGKLTSLKQFALERHVVLYGTENKTSGGTNGGASSTTSSRSRRQSIPEASIVPNEQYRAPPPPSLQQEMILKKKEEGVTSSSSSGATTTGTLSANSRQDGTRRLVFGRSCDNEYGFDCDVSMRMNDVSGLIGVQRGVWVLSQSDDVGTAAAKHLSKALSLDLVAPEVVLERAIKDMAQYVVDNELRKEEMRAEREAAVEEAAAAAGEAEAGGEAEAEAGGEAETLPAAKEEEKEKDLPISLSVAVGRKLLSGVAVPQEDLDILLRDEVVKCSSGGASSRGFVLFGYPRTLEQANDLSSKLSFAFEPEKILMLECDDASMSLRNDGLRLSFPSCMSTSLVDRSARVASVESIRASTIKSARDEKIRELREAAEEEVMEGEGEEKPNYEKMTNSQLEIDLESLELPELPTEEELHGSLLHVQPPPTSGSALLLPLQKKEQELQRTKVVHVNLAQPLDKVLHESLFGLIGGWASPFGLGCVPSTVISFPTLPEDLHHPVPMVTEIEPLVGLVESEESEEGAAAGAAPAAEEEKKETGRPSNPPLTQQQVQHLLYNASVQVEEVASNGASGGEGDEEEESEETSNVVLNQSLGRFLTDDVVPHQRRFGWSRTRCPVALVDGDELVYGRPEYACMSGGKVYVLSSEEHKKKFLSHAQRYVAARPSLPNTRTACIVSAPFTNTATMSAAKCVADKYDLRLLSASNIVSASAVQANGPEGCTSGALAELMVAATTSMDGGKGGWIMEGCPLTSIHVNELVSRGWNPDVVVVFAPPDPKAEGGEEGGEGGEDGENAAANTTTSIPVENVAVVDATPGLDAYREDHPALLEILTNAGIEVMSIPASGSSIDIFGEGDVTIMTGWLEQSVNPMMPRCDLILPETPISEGPLVSFAPTGPLCPVALKSGTSAMGKEEHGVSYVNGTKFLFCDARAKEEFDASPWSYDPVWSFQGVDGTTKTTPIRLLVMAPVGSSRREILSNVSVRTCLPIVSVGEDSEYIAALAKSREKKEDYSWALGDDGEEGEEEGEAAEEATGEEEEVTVGPPPVSLVYSVLERLLRSSVVSSGCVIDGDPIIFTPEVMSWMSKKRLHPSSVVLATMDPQVATERRVAKEFAWEPPVYFAGTEEELADEDYEPPPRPTREELQEQEEEAKSTLTTSIMEQEEESIGACEATVERLTTELSVSEILPRPSIGVGLRMASVRMSKIVESHVEECERRRTEGSVVILGTMTNKEEMSAEEIDESRKESEMMASRMIASGYKTMSPMMTRDPTLPRGGDEGQVGETGYACVFRHHVYFCDNEKNRDKFTSRPLFYLNKYQIGSSHSSPSPLSREPVTACIIGGPVSGKTSLALSLCREFNGIHLTPENVLQWALQSSSTSSSPACAKAAEELTSGSAIQSPRTAKEISSSLLLSCLRARIQRADCKTQGWILDGFPACAADARAMTDPILGIKVGVVLSLENLPHVITMKRARESKKRTTQEVTEELQIWIHERESMKASLSQAYLNVRHINVGGGRSEWPILDSARLALCTSRAKIQSRSTALLLRVPAPLDGVGTIHSNELMSKRGHLGGYCPMKLAEENRLVATGHGSWNQRRFGATYCGRVYSCSDALSLERFSSNPDLILSSTILPDKLPLVVPLGSHLRSAATTTNTLAFGGYCSVTFKEGRGLRDWSSIIEADPVRLVQYNTQIYGFSDAARRRKFMEQPHLYVGLELPIKLPPKMQPISMSQLKNGGLHGVLAVAEQSLSLATQEALISLGEHRMKFPSLGVTETASKFVALHLKSTNPSSTQDIREKYSLKLREFVEECSLAGFLSDNQEVLNNSTPRGSGIKAVRGMSVEKKKKMDEYMNNARKFELLCGERSEQLYDRYMQ